jgi:hypothetical protein
MARSVRSDPTPHGRGGGAAPAILSAGGPAIVALDVFVRFSHSPGLYERRDRPDALHLSPAPPCRHQLDRRAARYACHGQSRAQPLGRSRSRLSPNPSITRARGSSPKRKPALRSLRDESTRRLRPDCASVARGPSVSNRPYCRPRAYAGGQSGPVSRSNPRLRNSARRSERSGGSLKRNPTSMGEATKGKPGESSGAQHARRQICGSGPSI